MDKSRLWLRWRLGRVVNLSINDEAARRTRLLRVRLGRVVCGNLVFRLAARAGPIHDKFWLVPTLDDSLNWKELRFSQSGKSFTTPENGQETS
jgi:hypothetical protein